MNIKSSNISLIVGLALPVIMIFIIAAVIIIPSKLANPQTDFLYAVGPYPTYTTRGGSTEVQHYFEIKNGKLVETNSIYNIPSDSRTYPIYPPEKSSPILPKFYIHRTATDTNEEISIEDAKKITVLDTETSPDGYSVSYGPGRSGGVFPFFYESRSDKANAYLSNGTASKKITISVRSDDYYSFQHIGWLEK